MLLSFLLSTTLRAQTPEPITWQRSIQLATQNNADLSAAIATDQSTRELEGVARSGFFPAVNATMSYARGDQTSVFNNAGAYSASLSGTENIFNGLLDISKYRQAEANTRAAEAVLQATKARISNDLVTAFEGADYAKRNSKLTAQIVERRNDNLRLVTMRFQGGREDQGAVLLSKANLQQAKLDDVSAHDDLATAQAQLASVLGMDHFSEFDLQDEVPVHEPTAPTSYTSLAVKTPDYAQAVAQEQAADLGVDIARSGFFPTLSVTASTGKSGAYFFPDDRDRWRVEADLTFPLFSGGHDYYSTRSAAETHRQAEKARISISRQLLFKLQTAYYNYSEAVLALSVAQSFREAAALRAEISRKKYNNGLMTFQDWDLTENDLITREKNYLQAKKTRVLAESAWQQALGQGVIP
jgi:outer membrane protein TolC